MSAAVIDVLVPTFGRAERLGKVAANIRAATTVEHRVVFVVESDDPDSVAAADEHGDATVINTRARNYSGAATCGYRALPAPYLFAGADDLHFHPGWAEAALEVMGAAGRVEVVGTNDLCNPYVAQGFHATHYLVARSYLDRDGGCVDEGPGSFLFDGYSHQFTDTEFIATTKARARFMPCLDSIVEHMHFTVGKSARDDTYDRAYAELDADEALYMARRELWFNISR